MAVSQTRSNIEHENKIPSKILGPKIALHNVLCMKIPVIFVFYDINLEKINTKWGTVYVNNNSYVSFEKEE